MKFFIVFLYDAFHSSVPRSVFVQNVQINEIYKLT